MSRSYLHAMSILVTNLGCEMIYVLCSRLKAQNISDDKAIKVINDVACSLFDDKFIFKINAPQEIGKLTSIKQLFDKLAHSSIMKLNSTSMAKLFDLMLMSLKLQTLRVRYPEELAQMSTNHLMNVIDILKIQNEETNKKAIQLVQSQLNYFQSIFDSYSSWDFVSLKQTLLRFFQGKNIKVSIFMTEQLQSDTGIIYLPMNENAPPLIKKPGLICDYTNGLIPKESIIDLPISKFYVPSEESYRSESFTNLGRNIFLGEAKESISFKRHSVKYNFKTKNDNTTKTINNQTNYTSNTPINPITPINPNIIDSTLNSLVNNKIINDEERQKIDSNKNTPLINEGEKINYLNSNNRNNNIQQIKQEFNDLADLLTVKSNYTKNEEFELDFAKDDNWIRVEHIKTNKYDNMFDNLKTSNNNIQDDEDDLLDMMDKAIK
jgi:hypothetical protein